MSAHTPGPWEWWTSNSVRRLTGPDGKDGGVMYAYPHAGTADICVSEANARLIAAAPDLLNALRSVLGWWDESGPGDMLPIALEADARAAIAKAEGKS